MQRQQLSIAGIALWLFWQLTALGLAAFRVPLSARYPAAAEQWGLALMLVTQIAGASLLFPILLKNAPATLVAIALAWPICELASFVADADLHTFAVGEMYVSSWLIVLYLWNRFTADALSQGYLASLVALITFGGPLVGYLHRDFYLSSTSWLWPSATCQGPIVGALSLIRTPSSLIEYLCPLLALAIAAPMISLITKTFRPRPSA